MAEDSITLRPLINDQKKISFWKITEEMNNKRRSRAWCFTLNNPLDEEEKSLKELECRYMIFGREVGEEGTPHLQGYVYFKSLKSLKQVKKCMPRAHLEVAKGNPDQNIEYCSKDGDVFERGDKPIGGKRKSASVKERMERNKKLKTLSLNELVDSGEISILAVRKLKNARLDLAQEGAPTEADACRGVWYYGPPGTGKSHKARMENPGAYIKAQNKWWDGYAGEDVVILDDFDSKVLGHHLKIWADKWAATGEVKGGKVNLRYSKFIITSNYHPSELWPEDERLEAAITRRFKITHFSDYFTK